MVTNSIAHVSAQVMLGQIKHCAANGIKAIFVESWRSAITAWRIYSRRFKK